MSHAYYAFYSMTINNNTTQSTKTKTDTLQYEYNLVT